MNKDDRKSLEELSSKLGELSEDADGYASEFQDRYDNMPENLQDSEKGSALSDQADRMQSIADSIKDIVTEIDDLLGDY